MSQKKKRKLSAIPPFFPSSISNHHRVQKVHMGIGHNYFLQMQFVPFISVGKWHLSSEKLIFQYPQMKCFALKLHFSCKCYFLPLPLPPTKVYLPRPPTPNNFHFPSQAIHFYRPPQLQPFPRISIIIIMSKIIKDITCNVFF